MTDGTVRYMLTVRGAHRLIAERLRAGEQAEQVLGVAITDGPAGACVRWPNLHEGDTNGGNI